MCRCRRKGVKGIKTAYKWGEEMKTCIVVLCKLAASADISMTRKLRETKRVTHLYLLSHPGEVDVSLHLTDSKISLQL